MDHRDRRFVIQDRPKSPRENWDWQERQIALYQISLEFGLPFLDQNELIERSRIDIALKRAYAIQPIRLIGPAIPSQLDSDLVTSSFAAFLVELGVDERGLRTVEGRGRFASPHLHRWVELRGPEGQWWVLGPLQIYEPRLEGLSTHEEYDLRFPQEQSEKPTFPLFEGGPRGTGLAPSP